MTYDDDDITTHYNTTARHCDVQAWDSCWLSNQTNQTTLLLSRNQTHLSQSVIRTVTKWSSHLWRSQSVASFSCVCLCLFQLCTETLQL